MGPLPLLFTEFEKLIKVKKKNINHFYLKFQLVYFKKYIYEYKLFSYAKFLGIPNLPCNLCTM